MWRRRARRGGDGRWPDRRIAWPGKWFPGTHRQARRASWPACGQDEQAGTVMVKRQIGCRVHGLLVGGRLLDRLELQAGAEHRADRAGDGAVMLHDPRAEPVRVARPFGGVVGERPRTVTAGRARGAVTTGCSIDAT